MQFKALVVLSFLALTGSAQRCLKGNHANQGEGCEGVGNLICSHNYKHVVSDLTSIGPSEEPFVALVARIYQSSTNCVSLQLVCDGNNKWQRSSNCGGLCLAGSCHCG